MIAMAGLPIYIHAPKFYVDSYQISLGTLGATLFGLRLLDVVQDPFLGGIVAGYPQKRGLMMLGAGALMAVAMVGLFAVTPPFAPLLWFVLCLTLLFSAFSLASICFYAQGIAKAQGLGPLVHIRLAGWRESGALVGVSLAAVAPIGAFDFYRCAFCRLCLWVLPTCFGRRLANAVRMARGAQYPLCARVFAPSNLAKDHAQIFDIGAFEQRACGGNFDPLFIFCGKPLAKPFGGRPAFAVVFPLGGGFCPNMGTAC